LPRATRYTLGAKIDNLFTHAISIALTAKYTRQVEKITKLKQISEYLDYLKYFLTILWEIKGIDNKKFAELASKLDFIGKMIGGLIRYLEQK